MAVTSNHTFPDLDFMFIEASATYSNNAYSGLHPDGTGTVHYISLENPSGGAETFIKIWDTNDFTSGTSEPIVCIPTQGGFTQKVFCRAGITVSTGLTFGANLSAGKTQSGSSTPTIKYTVMGS
jgi:hypothetical protein